MELTQKAVLAVSFGTSYQETRKKTIDQIEKEIARAYPEYRIYRAWTSKMIIARLKSRDGVVIPTVTEALENMLSAGIRELVVQPTHMLGGIENDRMREDVLRYSGRFGRISFGAPLLTSARDKAAVISAVMEEFPLLGQREALVFMGHGTPHLANSVYEELDRAFKESGYPHVFLGTVEAYPSIEEILERVRVLGPEKVILAPFMVVAGDHAVHDMASGEEDSWKSRFQRAGFPVECVMRGLGEYAGVRRVYVEHVADAMYGK